jgi:hypothetical protein
MLLYAANAVTMTKESELKLVLRPLYPAEVQNLKIQLDARRLVISFVFSLFQRLTAAPYHRAKNRKLCSNKNNKRRKPRNILPSLLEMLTLCHFNNFLFFTIVSLTNWLMSQYYRTSIIFQVLRAMVMKTI